MSCDLRETLLCVRLGGSDDMCLAGCSADIRRGGNCEDISECEDDLIGVIVFSFATIAETNSLTGISYDLRVLTP